MAAIKKFIKIYLFLEHGDKYSCQVKLAGPSAKKNAHRFLFNSVTSYKRQGTSLIMTSAQGKIRSYRNLFISM